MSSGLRTVHERLRSVPVAKSSESEAIPPEEDAPASDPASVSLPLDPDDDDVAPLVPLLPLLLVDPDEEVDDDEDDDVPGDEGAASSSPPHCTRARHPKAAASEAA